jgi:hypothetical protein
MGSDMDRLRYEEERECERLFKPLIVSSPPGEGNKLLAGFPQVLIIRLRGELGCLSGVARAKCTLGAAVSHGYDPPAPRSRRAGDGGKPEGHG